MRPLLFREGRQVTDKVATTLFKYTVNVQEFLAQNERVRASVVATLDETKKQALSVEEAGKRVNRALAEIARAKGVSQIAADFHTAERAGVSTADSFALVAQQLSKIGASDEEIRSVTRALIEQGDAAERAGRAQAAQARGVSAGRVGSTATQILGGVGAGDASGAAGLIGDITEAVTELTPAGLALTGVLGGLGIVAQAISADMERAQERAEAYFARASQIAELVVSGATSAQVEELVRQREQELAAIGAQIDNLEPLMDMLERTGTRGTVSWSSFYDTLEDATNGQITSIEQLTSRYDTLTSQYDAANLALDELNLTVEDTRVVANDARVAEILRLQAIEDAANAEAARAQGIAEFRREIDDMRRAERDALEQRLQDEAALLSYLAGVQYGEELERTNARLQTVRDQLDELGATSDTTADRLARVEAVMAHAAAAEERRTDAAAAYLDAVEATTKAQAALVEAEMARAALEQEHAARLTEITLEQQTREQDAAATAAQERIEAAEEFERQRLQIERRSNAILSNAIAARDALAFYLERQKKQEALDNLKEAEEERLEKIDDSYKKQLKAAEDYALKAAASEQARYTKQLQIEQAAAAQSRVNLENAKRNEAYIQQMYAQLSVNTEAQRQTAINQVMAAGLNASLGMAESWAQSWTFAIGYGLGIGAIGGAAGSGGTGGSGSIYQPTATGAGRSLTVNAPINITGGGDSSAIVESAVRQVRVAIERAVGGRAR